MFKQHRLAMVWPGLKKIQSMISSGIISSEKKTRRRIYLNYAMESLYDPKNFIGSNHIKFFSLCV
jgi:hypothetical protein